MYPRFSYDFLEEPDQQQGSLGRQIEQKLQSVTLSRNATENHQQIDQEANASEPVFSFEQAPDADRQAQSHNKRGIDRIESGVQVAAVLQEDNFELFDCQPAQLFSSIPRKQIRQQPEMRADPPGLFITCQIFRQPQIHDMLLLAERDPGMEHNSVADPPGKSQRRKAPQKQGKAREGFYRFVEKVLGDDRDGKMLVEYLRCNMRVADMPSRKEVTVQTIRARVARGFEKLGARLEEIYALADVQPGVR